MKWTTGLLAGAAILGAACTAGDVTKPAPPPPPTGALLIRSERDSALSADTLTVGGNVWLRVSGVDTSADVTWSVNDTTVSGVVERHKARLHVNGRKVGNATVTASLGNRTGTFGLLVQQSSATNHPPVARVTGPTSAVEGDALTYNAESSSDPDHDVLRYTWSFGDGSANDSGSTVTHTFTDNGSRTVSVIVADGRGLADTASITTTVKNAPPQISALAVPTAPVHLGDTVKVTATVSDPGTSDVLTISFDWGDGKTSSGSDTHGAHLYAAAGTYSVKATVRDDDGDSASRSGSVEVAQGSQVAGYEVIDLGTLGGSSAQSNDFNDYGQIVGSSVTAAGSTHAFVWQNGVMTDLGTFGRQNSTAYRINNHGLIAGGVWTDYNAYGWPRTTPTTWDASTGSGHTIDGAPWPMAAAAINESGEIAWYTRGFQYEYGYVLRNGTWQAMGSLLASDAPASNPNATNEHFQVVGMSPAAGQSVSPDERAFLWEDGVMRDLGVLGLAPCNEPSKQCATASADGINESGRIAGWSSASDGHMHAVLWENGTIKDLWTAPGSLPGSWSRWNRWAVINDAGQIAGSAQGEAFFWSNGSVRSLGSLGGGGTQVVDLNEAGMVVGTSMTASGEQHAFVWSESRGMVDLGTGPAGFNCAWVVGISFGGDVAGYTARQNPSARCAEAPQGTRALLWRKAGN